MPQGWSEGRMPQGWSEGRMPQGGSEGCMPQGWPEGCMPQGFIPSVLYRGVHAPKLLLCNNMKHPQCVLHALLAQCSALQQAVE